MNVAVQVSQLRVFYGPTPALRGVDLDVAWGEHLAVFGPNGSGKSTLIRVLATLTRPTGGAVHLGGIALHGDPGRVRSMVGVTTHRNLLYGALTVRENLQFYGRMYGLKDVVGRIAEVGEELALTPVLNLRVRTLSNGMQRRAALARALLHSPPLLLLDEPDAGLDQEAQGLLAGILDAHRSAGGSAIVTTHNVEQGLALADRAVILSRGRVAHEGTWDSADAPAFRQAYARHTGVAA